jgi:predicted kinase
VTRRSVSGIIVFLNSTPVKWYSKMQNTVETSTYGSELVAARIATDLAIEYRYLCRMLGHEVDGPVTMLGDNNAVVLNTTVPSSQLKKKHAACAYHRVREAIAAKIIRFCHINSEDNIADILTKPLNGVIHHRLIRPVMDPKTGDGVPHVFKLPPGEMERRATLRAKRIAAKALQQTLETVPEGEENKEK